MPYLTFLRMYIPSKMSEYFKDFQHVQICTSHESMSHLGLSCTWDVPWTSAMLRMLVLRNFLVGCTLAYFIMSMAEFNKICLLSQCDS